jgi:hypothetical protein
MNTNAGITAQHITIIAWRDAAGAERAEQSRASMSVEASAAG